MSTCIRGGITYKRHTFVDEVCTKCGRAQFLDLDKDDAYETIINDSIVDQSEFSSDPPASQDILDTE